jgi:hypothetical protein
MTSYELTDKRGKKIQAVSGPLGITFHMEGDDKAHLLKKSHPMHAELADHIKNKTLKPIHAFEAITKIKHGVNESYHNKKGKEKMPTKKKPEVTEEAMEGDNTSAASSIEAKPSDASKSAMMAQAMTSMAAMDKSQLDQVLAMMNSKQFASTIPDDAAAKNAASVAMKGAVKEDVAELFAGEQLSEEFKEKTAVLFEAAVNAKVIAEVARIEEEYETKLEEEVAQVTDTLTEQIDHYMSYVAQNWLEENQVAIDNSLRNELAEDFIMGLRNLFAEHYVQFPDEQVDAVEALAEKVEELEARLNEQLEKNIEMSAIVEERNKEKIFAEVSEGLALTQVDKFKTLTEGVEFENNPDNYKKKLEIVKEKYFGIKQAPSTLNEEVEEPTATQEVKYLEPQIANYAKAISRTIKK